MKFYTQLKIFFGICLVFAIATTATAVDISGTWVADVDGNHIEMTFTIDGTTLTGTVDNSESGSAEIKEGTVEGSKVSFHVLRKLSSFGDSEFKVVWSGEVIGDEILFKREFAGTSKGVIAKRGKPASDTENENPEDSYDHLSGKWSGRVPLGEMNLELQVKGSSLSGTVNINGMDVGEIKDGKIEGDKIIFHTIRQRGLNTVDIPFEGIVKGEKIHFSFISVNNGMPVNFVASKKESAPEIQEEEQTVQETEGEYDYLSGKWTANYSNGVMLMNFKVNGNTLTGTVGPKELGQNEILDGKIKKDKISFHVLSLFLGRQEKGVWKGKIVGDKIHFNSQIAGNKLKFIAKKMELDEKGQIKEEVQLPPTVDPSGTWVMKADGKQFTMAFKAVGMSLTGIIRIPPQNSPMILPDAKINGDTISFSMMKQIGPRRFRVYWVGKVVGKEIHFDGGPFNQFESVIAKKVKDQVKDGEDNEPIKLVREEEIKKKKIRKKYNKLREKDTEYDSAMEFFDKYQYNLALPLLEQLFERLPKDSVVLHRLGVCLMMQSIYPSKSHDRKSMRARARSFLEKSKKLGMEDELLDYYLEVIPEDGGWDDSFSKREDAEQVLAEAEEAFQLRDLQKCIGLYAKAMEFDPTNYKAALYVGDSYFANGQHKDAIEWFERATVVDPDKETAWRYWGDCLLHLDKKDEGRSKFIDALIAEPYNRLSWNGVRNLINLIRQESKKQDIELKTPDIERPQRLEDSGELLITDDQSKSSPDGTKAWSYYNKIAKEWRSNKFKDKFPDEEEYRHTLEEEREALELVAEKVNEDINKGRISREDLNPGIKTLLEIQTAGLLEPYILFHLADRDIIKEYPDYRKSSRNKLEQYVDKFEVPKIGGQREL